jgi:hypothetical protein
MSMRKRTTWRAALTLALAAACLAPAVGAQPFTANIEIASQHPTLQDAIDAAGEGGMLIVDQDYPNLAPLVLPRRFRMTGKGPQGNAVLAFQGLAAGSAITIAPSGDAYVTIEDLDIEGPFSSGNGFVTTARGIDLTGANIVFLRRLVVRGFNVGVYGEESLSVYADQCNVSLSRTDNYQLTAGSNSWRITGGISSQAARYGVNAGVVNDTLIQGVRMESNSGASIFTNADGTHIANNRFECHVHPALPFCLATTRAVEMGASATGTTLVDNYYSGIGVVDSSTAHTTYRFDNGHAVEINPPAGIDALSVRVPGSASPELVVDDQAWVRLGPDQGTAARLTVNADASEDALRLRTGGITHLLLASDGQLGVGTSTPAAQLAVSSGSGEDALRVQTSGSTEPRLLVEDDGRVLVGSTGGVLSWLTVNAPAGEDPLRVRTAGTTRLMVMNTGNVGVGTSVPGARLQVAGGDVYVGTTGNGVILRSPNGSCFRVTVSNAGALGAAAVACP